MPFKFNPLTNRLDIVGLDNVTGDVTGPGSSTDSAIARWDGTTGKQLKDSSVVVTDLGVVEASGLTLTTPLAAIYGGTGLSSYGVGDILFADTTTSLSTLSVGSNGDVLTLSAGLPTWQAAPATGVTSVSGTANRITSTGGTTPVIDIDAAYVGQTSITTLGTITTGVWTGTNIALANGGTSASLVASNGGIFYSTGAAGAILSGTATAGQILRSGASSAPSWSTATFPATATSTGTILRADGTNWVATTATYPATTSVSEILYSSSANVIAGITTATNGVLVTGNTGIPSILAGPGTSGKILQSNAAAAPSFSTPTYPSISGTSGKILISDGTNIVYSTPTYPNSASTALKHIRSDGTNFITTTVTYPDASVTAGKVIISDGTNYIASTPTYPNAASTALKHIRSDGTNFITTTVTYPDASVTAGKVIISDGTNYIASTPTFPNASATSGKFIRSDGTNWIASTPTLPTSAGTAGKVLMSDATNYVESTPTYPSTSGTTGKILISDGTNNIYSTPTYPSTAGSSGNVLTSDGTNWTSSAPAAGGMTWSEVVGTSQSAAVGNGYICNNAGLVTVTLSGTAALGSLVAIQGSGAGGWALAANTGQTIKYGNQTTSSAGSLASTNRYDAVEVVCITANTTWAVRGIAQGNLTVA